MLKDYVQNNFNHEVELLIAQERFNKKLARHTVADPKTVFDATYQDQFDYETLVNLNELTVLDADYVKPESIRANCNGIMNIQLLNQLEHIYDDLYEEYRLKPDNEEEVNDLSMLITNISNAADRFYTMEHKETGSQFLVSPSVVVRVNEDQPVILYDALTYIKSHDNWDQSIEQYYDLKEFANLNPDKVNFANSKVLPCLNDSGEVELQSIVQLEKDNAYYSMLTTNSLHFENDRVMFDKFIAESVELIEEGRKGCFKPLAVITKMLNTTNKTPVFKELKNTDLIDGKPDVRHYAYKSGENYKVIDETLKCLKGDDGKAVVLSRTDVLEALTNRYDIDEIEEEPKQIMNNKQSRRRFC